MGFLAPLALGLGGLGSFLGSRAQANQQKDQSRLYNDWLKNYQNTGQNLFNQAQAAGWNPYGPSVSTSQGQTSQQGGSSTSFRNSPFITDEYKGIDSLMRGIMTGRLSGGSSLPPGYASSGIRGINESFEGADAAARNLAARRGLSGEQTYAIASPANRARAGKIADFRANLPLLERQMQNEDIQMAQGLQSAFGRGESGHSNTSSFSNGTSYGTSSKPFDAGDLSQLMSVLAPPNPQQTTQTGQSAVGSGISSMGSLLGFLAANQQMKPPTTPPYYGSMPGEMPWGWRG